MEEHSCRPSQSSLYIKQVTVKLCQVILSLTPFKIILRLQRNVPCKNTCVLQSSFYFESRGSGSTSCMRKRDDIICRTAHSAVPSKVRSLAILEKIRKAILVFTSWIRVLRDTMYNYIFMIYRGGWPAASVLSC